MIKKKIKKQEKLSEQLSPALISKRTTYVTFRQSFRICARGAHTSQQ